MRKAVWVVVVDNYQPELCEITLPNLANYAQRIGADFNIIRERRWPEASAPYEKLQVYELGADYDWNIVLDADLYIDDNMCDPTSIISDTGIASWMCYDALQYFPADEYLCKERSLGISFNFVIIPKSCHALLTPFPNTEIPRRLLSLKRPFMLDEYCISRNAAKFGFKYCGILHNLQNPPFRHLNLTSGHDSHF